MNSKSLMDIDGILPMIGEACKFQIILEILLCFMELPNGLLIMIPYFIQESPAWSCVQNSSICQLNGTFSAGQDGYDSRCNMPRNEWKFTREKDFSVITEFDIYCETEIYATLASSLPFVSWAIGGAFLGWIVDRLGRQKTVLASSAMVIIIGFVMSFSLNFQFYVAMRVLIGFFIPAAMAQKIVLICELVGSGYRPYFALPLGLAFGFSVSILSLLAYSIQKWRHLVLACTAPYLATFLFYWYNPFDMYSLICQIILR